MKKRTLVLAISFLTILLSGITITATSGSYFANLPAWMGHVTCYENTKSSTGDETANYVGYCNINPDAIFWFDVQQSNGSWIRVSDDYVQNIYEHHVYDLYNSYGEETRIRMRGKCTHWGASTSYWVSGTCHLY